jgi:hypothetical protein
VSKEEKEQATKWIAGLDRIHGARGILTCYDLSATPFVPGGGGGAGDSEDKLFKWIVSDFGLNDAIESGLVKTPRVVIRDDALPDVQTYKSKLYHLYAATDENGNRIRDDLNRDAEPQEALPQLVLNAYYLLGVDWLKTKRAWEEKKHPVPPVMITVCIPPPELNRHGSVPWSYRYSPSLNRGASADPSPTLPLGAKRLSALPGTISSGPLFVDPGLFHAIAQCPGPPPSACTTSNAYFFPACRKYCAPFWLANLSHCPTFVHDGLLATSTPLEFGSFHRDRYNCTLSSPLLQNRYNPVVGGTMYPRVRSPQLSNKSPDCSDVT